MIKYEGTNHVWSVERPVVNAEVALISEGMALVSAVENGIAKVKRSSGNSADRFQGVALAPRRTFASNAKTESVVVPAGGGAVLLSKTAASNVIGAYRADTYAAVTVSAAAASASNIQYGTDATTGLTTLTFDSSFAGVTFIVSYNYTMSASEEQGLFGNAYAGFAPSDLLYQTGVFKIGRILVNNYDPQANWWGAAAGLGVKIIANGIFTDASNSAPGVSPSNVEIFQLPSATSPWLGLEIR